MRPRPAPIPDELAMRLLDDPDWSIEDVGGEGRAVPWDDETATRPAWKTERSNREGALWATR